MTNDQKIAEVLKIIISGVALQPGERAICVDLISDFEKKPEAPKKVKDV